LSVSSKNFIACFVEVVWLSNLVQSLTRW